MFILPRVMPGDPILNLFGERLTFVDPEVRQFLEEKYQLDRPLWDQYRAFLSSVVTMDFGYSIFLGMDINPLIGRRFLWTLILVLPSIFIGSFTALYFSVRVGVSSKSWKDNLTVITSILLHTVPGFFIGMICIRFFSLELGLFPLGHLSSGEYTGLLYYVDIIHHLALPVIVLSLLIGSSQFLILRNSVLQIKGDYCIFVARSKGLTEPEIAMRHITRNILPVFLSIFAMNIGGVVSGALLIEVVFSLRGMGTLLYDAISTQDYPLIQAIFILLTFSVLIMNLAAEVLYGIADPRVGDSSKGWNR